MCWVWSGKHAEKGACHACHVLKVKCKGHSIGKVEPALAAEHFHKPPRYTDKQTPFYVEDDESEEIDKEDTTEVVPKRKSHLFWQ